MSYSEFLLQFSTKCLFSLAIELYDFVHPWFGHWFIALFASWTVDWMLVFGSVRSLADCHRAVCPPSGHSAENCSGCQLTGNSADSSERAVDYHFLKSSAGSH